VPRLPFSIKRAEAHLVTADPVLARLVRAHGPYQPRPSDEPYEWLVRTVLFQQLAGNAARAIARKWFALYSEDGRVPTSAEILATSDEQFRAAGVSRQKASYFRDLAQRVEDGRLTFDGIARLSDAEVTERLTAVRGIGEWSAHMFLMFVLGRPDVLPTGDFGVRHGMRVAYGLDAVPTPARAREIGAPWAPYRSVGAWYMWRAVETVTPSE
jgi:DNA-3-methyladenine glycosylase II